MKKLERGIMNVTGCFLAALMFLMMVDIFAAVLVRYVFHTALNFSEELGRYVFVWIVFIGMARCIAADKHVALDLLPGFLKGKKFICCHLHIQRSFFLSRYLCRD